MSVAAITMNRAELVNEASKPNSSEHNQPLDLELMHGIGHAAGGAAV